MSRQDESCLNGTDRVYEGFLTYCCWPGLLCIGDAAHAMSPVGGVGINLAIHDAVAAANLLAEPLCKGAVSGDHLAKIQRRRSSPTRLTQRMQAIILKQVWRGLDKPQPAPPPWPRLLERKSQALAWLEKAYEGLDGALPFMKVNPRLAPLHSYGRFQNLVGRLNFLG